MSDVKITLFEPGSDADRLLRDLLSERDRLVAERDAVLTVLRSVERSATEESHLGTHHVCPRCRSWPHRDVCALAAALGAGAR